MAGVHKTLQRGPSFINHLTHDAASFGKKTIGFGASVALLVNNITGPGVPQLANMFAESGWLVPVVVFLLIWLMTSVSTTMYCEAMRKIPGNENFHDRIEYTSIVEYYFGRRAYVAAQVGLNGALQSLNIISVVQSAQVMDNAISAMFGKSCGLDVSPFAISYNGTALPASTDVWTCFDTNDLSAGNPWGCHVVVSLGYLVALALALPMGYFNLDDNMKVQVVAFALTFACWGVWLVACFFSPNFGGGGDWSLPAVNTGPSASQAGVLGTILFNFGFVTTVPSWVNEKKPGVSVNRAVWYSTALCILIFFVMGIPGAMAFKDILAGVATGDCPNGSCAGDLMAVFTTKQFAPAAIRNNRAFNFIVQFSVYLFPVVAVLSSIPVFSIVIKYNCVENGWSRTSAFLWGVVFPWAVALPLLYQPDALNQFITFSSLIFVSFTDFIVPWCLYITLARNEHSGAPLGGEGGPAGEQQPMAEPINDNDHDNDNDGDGGAGRYPRMGHTGGAASEQTALLGKADPAGEVVHYAFPPSWGLSLGFKIHFSTVLVVVMAVLAVVGTALSIETSVASTWVCSTVGS